MFEVKVNTIFDIISKRLKEIKMQMITLDDLKKEIFKNPDVKREYDALDDEFKFISTLLDMRQKAGLTQEALSEKMGINKRSISRLESGNGNPGWKTLQKYARACGFRIELQVTRHTS